MIWSWLATRAASGWIAAVGVALLTTAYVAYDHRGDKIASLELELLQCKGSARQAKAIDNLSKRITEQLQDKADDDIERLNEIPNACYELDGPSPLDQLRRTPSQSKAAEVLPPAEG